MASNNMRLKTRIISVDKLRPDALFMSIKARITYWRRAKVVFLMFHYCISELLQANEIAHDPVFVESHAALPCLLMLFW